MIRGCLAGVLALALVGCAASEAHSAGDDPAWMKERIAIADARTPGYPAAANIPDAVPAGTVRREWAEGVAGMVARRDAVMSDPSLADPDADTAEDAVAFTTRSREQADQAVELLSEDALE